jgi:hypothetical protein
MSECKHDWTFVNGLTKRIRCTRCAAMQFVDRDQYTDIVSDGGLDPRNVFDVKPISEYERGFIDGMQEQLKRIVEKEVNK